jgi:hypothetical protein
MRHPRSSLASSLRAAAESLCGVVVAQNRWPRKINLCVCRLSLYYRSALLICDLPVAHSIRRCRHVSALDDLKAAVAARQDVAAELRAAANQSEQIAQEAREASKAADYAEYVAKSRRHNAELRELGEIRKLRDAEYKDQAANAQAAVKSAEDAENVVAELERTWPPSLGPFPERNPKSARPGSPDEVAVTDTDYAPAVFEALFKNFYSLQDPELTWLEIATRLLTYCYEYRPSASSWVGHDQAKAGRTIYEVELTAATELFDIDRDFFPTQPGDRLKSKLLPSAFATYDHVSALEKVAFEALAASPFKDTRLSLALVARGLAGAIDNLAGSTFIEWFRRNGELTIAEGKPHPVCSHDPSRWLGEQKANTNPAKHPGRELTCTPSLRIAIGPFDYDYILDFNLWNQLGLLGSGPHGLVMAAAQPNLDGGEFHMEYETPPATWGTTPATWYANHGPDDTQLQIDRITRLVDGARAKHAQLIVLPEYAVSDPVYDALEKWLFNATDVLILCAGVSIPDANHYVKNLAWLSVGTPGIRRRVSKSFHAKTSGASLGTIGERILADNKVRIFISQEWSLCVLICIETLDSAIIDELAKIGVNILLVPSMSEKTNGMVGEISELCYKSQAFVAMANGPANWTGSDDLRCEAFFAGPYAKARWSWSKNRAIGAKTPPSDIAYWVFGAASARVTCVQLPSK